MTFDLTGGGEMHPGLVLRTKRGRMWLVVSVRRVRSKHPNRWALEIERATGRVDCECNGRGCGDGACPVLSMRWNPRGVR